MFKPIIFSIRVPVETCKTAAGVVAICEFLNVSEAGRSTDEALTALTDSLTGCFQSSFDRGRFDLLFRCNGYSARMIDPLPSGGRFVDVRLTLTAPHKVLSKTEIAGGIRSALERCAA